MPAVRSLTTENPSTVAAETSLWYQASTAFSDGRYSAAIHLYERYLTNYPKSRRANWRPIGNLGQAYEQMGEVTAAIKEYRTLAGPEGAPRCPSQSVLRRTRPASNRCVYATNRLRPAGARSGHTALYVSFSNLPPMSQVEAWIRQLSAQGISAILDGCQSGVVLYQAADPHEPTHEQPAADSARWSVVCHVAWARAHGLVRGAWCRRPMSWGFPSMPCSICTMRRLSDHRQESRMLLYDPTRRKVHPWTQFDLLAPPVQQELAQLLADLVRSGVDGMVFRARAENSFAYEVSDGVLRQFETQVRQPSSDVAQALRERMTVRQDAGALASDKTLWRWVGWKARQELDVLARLKKYVQKAVPRLRMVLEIHPEALSNPTSALVNYGEDAAEARRRGFDLLLGGAVS
jgi:tetratricopeptide (TPR) repeat protein